MKLFKKYCCVNQHDDNDCGIASLATIAKSYGIDISFSKIRELACIDNEGTSVLGIVKAARNIGFNAKAFKTKNKSQLLSEYPKPCIAHIYLENHSPHFVVIHEVNKDEIIIAEFLKRSIEI